MRRLMHVCRLSSSYKTIIIIFSILFFLLIFSGCDMISPADDASKIDIADASEPKSISPQESTEGPHQETSTTEEATEEILVEREIEIQIYYSDEMAEFIVGETKKIIGTTKEDFIIAAFHELLKEPINEDLYNLIPEGTSIIDAKYEGGVATVNLSKEFVDNKGSELVNTLTLACIVGTLTEIEGVEGVLFEAEGEKIDLYGSHDLSLPISRNYSLIKGS